MIQKAILFAAAIALIGGCASPEKTDQKKVSKEEISKRFDQILDNYYEAKLKLNPISATYAGDNRYNDRFPNFLSDKYVDRLKNYYTAYRDSITEFDDADLSDTQKMSKAIVDWESDINLATYAFKNWKYFPIDQMWTINLVMGQLASGKSAQPFKTVTDYMNWLDRLDGYVVWLHTAEDNMRKGIVEGYVLPKPLIQKVVPQLRTMAEQDLDKNLFYAPIKNLPDDFSDKEKEKLTEAYSKMITNKIVPTYTNLYTFMETDYLKAGRTSTGIAAIPDGEAYYKHQIKRYTTTDMTADEIHQLGLSEVKRITKEMEKVKDQIGFEGDLLAFFEYVRSDKDLMPYTAPQEIIDHFYTIYETMKPRLNELFDHEPKTEFEIRQTEAFRENSASAEYSSGSLDGTRPGIFYVPIPDASKYNIYSDEALFLHEAIPGHHYQISLTQENEELPMFRKTLYYSGYGEGWALYCESLGKELGLYTDPFQYFGMLSMEMHRAIRLVIDTGMHSKGWSREKAIQYSLDHEAESKESIIAEVERYMANPGQALAYKVGQLKIRALRDKARKELGSNFEIAKFHNQILETGCIPLELLENKINRWIDEKKQEV